ncbi:RluA family pseudouridine synthase [Lichenicoccus sp.]|uniref:RluA family pseudouridine synthase n=1 Tax=Lichenicoccus sp. TaxID=2781899 RepID=UPI003D0CB85D
MVEHSGGHVVPFTLVASAAQAGQRTDRFLADAIGTASRSRVKALMQAGSVRRNGTVLRDAADPVRPGQCYSVEFPPAVAARPQGEAIALSILHEDDSLIVLDKPPGLVVHPAPGNQAGTLVNALIGHCGDDLPGIGGERRPGIVHRLDKDTSGLMVVAKTEAALAALSADFAARRIERSYLGLCWGMLTPAAGAIEGAIGRDPRDRKRMAVVARGGKPALTHYRTLEILHGAVSLVACRLATGRTHQIRVHLSHQGHPLLGDPVYLRRVPGPARLLDDATRRAALDFPRQALHAQSLGFTHPATGAFIRFSSEPPADFHALKAQITANSGSA